MAGGGWYFLGVPEDTSEAVEDPFVAILWFDKQGL